MTTVPKQQDDGSRRTSMFVLIYKDQSGQTQWVEKETTKETLDFIGSIGGPENVLKLYVGAKERVVKTVVSYTF